MQNISKFLEFIPSHAHTRQHSDLKICVTALLYMTQNILILHSQSCCILFSCCTFLSVHGACNCLQFALLSKHEHLHYSSNSDVDFGKNERLQLPNAHLNTSTDINCVCLLCMHADIS